MDSSKYKYKIDKEALTKFFTDEVPSKKSLRAVKLVIMTVLVKHYSKFVNLREELISQCLVKLLEIKPRYDLSYSSYNYAYTACRNEIGNFLKRHREVVVEDILPLSNASVDEPSVVSLPPEINKFKKYLTGEQKYETLDITAKEAINLAVFVEQNQPTRKLTPPDFIIKGKHSIDILYKILVKL